MTKWCVNILCNLYHISWSCTLPPSVSFAVFFSSHKSLYSTDVQTFSYWPGYLYCYSELRSLMHIPQYSKIFPPCVPNSNEPQTFHMQNYYYLHFWGWFRIISSLQPFTIFTHLDIQYFPEITKIKIIFIVLVRPLSYLEFPGMSEWVCVLKFSLK